MTDTAGDIDAIRAAHDWQHTQPPYLPDQPLRVWLEDGSVRSVSIVSRRDPGTLWFVERNLHPLANAICSRRNVLAWRLP